MAEVKLTRSVLCDHARNAENGKVDLIGVFDVMLPEHVPAVLPPFFAYFRLEPTEDQEELGEEFTLVFEVKGPPDESTSLFKVSGTGRIAPSIAPGVVKGSSTVIVQCIGILATAFGKYTMTLTIDGTPLEPAVLNVIQMPSPTA